MPSFVFPGADGSCLVFGLFFSDSLYVQTYVFTPGIRQLQLMLLKVCLMLGVEIHVNVEFVKLMEPPEEQTEDSKCVRCDRTWGLSFCSQDLHARHFLCASPL